MSYHSDVFIGDDEEEGGAEEEEEDEEIVYAEGVRLANTPEARRRHKNIVEITNSPSSSRGSGSTPVDVGGAEGSSSRPRRSSRKQQPLGWGFQGLYARFTKTFNKAWREVRFRGE